MSKRTDQGGWPPSGFGQALKGVRERRGLTQDALAQAAGCSKFTVAKLEAASQEPAWPLVLALAGALGATPNDFMLPAGTVVEPKAARARGRPKKAKADAG